MDVRAYHGHFGALDALGSVICAIDGRDGRSEGCLWNCLTGVVDDVALERRLILKPQPHMSEKIGRGSCLLRRVQARKVRTIWSVPSLLLWWIHHQEHMHLPLGHGGMSAGTSNTVSRCHTHVCCTENTTMSSGRTTAALSV